PYLRCGPPACGGRTGEKPGNPAESSGRDLRRLVDVGVAKPGSRVQQHRRLLPLLGRAVVEATVRWPLVHRLTAGNGRGQPALAGQQPGLRTALVVRALIRI